jgi:hypothetical protein
MSLDYSDTKKPTGSVYPVDAVASGGGLERIEPLITPEVLQRRYFFGIPLVSPLEPKQKLTPADLQDFIVRGSSKVELDTKTTIQPVTRRMRLPFDATLYARFLYLELPFKPILRVIRLAICSSSYQGTSEESERYPSGNMLYRIPADWIDTSHFSVGKLFCNPLQLFNSIGLSDTTASAGTILPQLTGLCGFIPAYWTVECETGFCSREGNVPVVVNELVGTAAAILLCDNLIPLFRVSSQSLSLDGLGQSTQDDMQRLLKQKRDDLERSYGPLLQSVKGLINTKFIVSNV